MGLEDLTLKNKGFAYGLAAIIGSGGFYFGYFMSIFNPIGKPLLTGHYKMTEDQADNVLGNVNLFFCIGAGLACILFGKLSDLFGRVRLLIAFEFLAIIASACYYVDKIPLLYTARFFGGMIAGVNVAGGSVVLSELFPKSVSGFGGTFIYVNITFSILVSFIEQTIFGVDTLVKYWRVFLIWPVIISIARMVLIAALIRVDTPKFYLARTKDESQLRRKIVDSLKYLYQEVECDSEAEKIIEENRKESQEIGIVELFGPTYRFRAFGGCLLNLLQQLCGINFLIFFSTDLFNDLSGNGETMTTVLGVANFLGSFVAIYAIERFGRRFNLVTGVLLQLIAFSTLSFAILIESSWIPVISVILYMVGFAVGLGATIIPYTADILPPIGVGLANAIQWIGAASIGKFVPILSKQ